MKAPLCKKDLVEALIVFLAIAAGMGFGLFIGYRVGAFDSLNWGLEQAKNYIKVNGIQLQNWK